MIFKRLFKPAHQSADASTRKAAVDKLSPHKPQEKAALHELAFNDSDPGVTLAALRRLDKFALWQKTAQLSRFDVVKRTARQEVEKAVLAEQGRELDNQQRIDYLKESADSDLIRRALMKPVDGLDDSTTLQLLSKVGQDDFTLQYYQNQASEKVREALIQNASDPQLDKYLRKESSDTLIRIIDEHKQARDEQKRKPEAVQQALTLLLSKLKALLDKADFAEIKRRQLLLVDEYHQLSDELTWLDSEAQARAADKFKTLHARVDAHLEKLRPAWEEAQQSEQIQALLADAHSAANAASQAVNALYGEDRTAVAMASVEHANTCLEALEHAISQLPDKRLLSADSREKARLTQTFERLGHLVAIFPTQQHLAKQFETFLKTADEQQAVTQEALDALEQEYDAYVQKIEQMPEAWLSQWRDIRKRHKKALKSAKEASDAKTKSVRRLLSIVGSLISEGRYKAALSRYSSLKTEFDSLSSADQSRLQRRFEDIRTQVERLEGWQSYLAAPRKPELLTQAEMLASQRPDSIKARAKQIKVLREQWQSLTKPGDNSEESVQFDAALEKAFAPCREHYAKQEEIREQAKHERLKLIEAVNQLSASQEDITAIAKRYEQLKQEWRSAGQVEKTTYETLKKQWGEASSSVNQRVTQWHLKNREQKQALIDAVNALQAIEDRQAAATQAQHLQKEWKQVGHAGPKHENKLWRAFKQANDTLFDALKSQQADTKEKQKVEAQQWIDIIDALLAELTETDASAAQRQLDKIKADAGALSKAVPKLDKKLKFAETIVRDARDHKRKDARKAEYRALLSGLSAWTDADSPATDQIPDEVWRAMNKQHQSVMLKPLAVNADRGWFTTQLELLADYPSPEAFTAQRQDIQLAMMMDKLESGESYSLNDTLLRWISCGPVTQDDSALHTRFREVIEQRLINHDKKSIEQ